nr:MAG TPA: hypothetical protein [Caudoviricetes sp.]
MLNSFVCATLTPASQCRPEPLFCPSDELCRFG